MANPSRRRRALLLTAVTAVLLSVPAAVWAGHQFTDVPDSHIFHTGITWMKDNNITVGCNPPTNNQYCPDDNVTRGQMATFMKRLAENNVVDAATLDGIDSADFALKSDLATSGTTTLGAASFTADAGGSADWTNGCVRNTVASFQLRSAVQVPAGATITSVTGFIFDSDGAANGSLALRRTTTSVSTLATATSSGTGLQNVTADLATPELVDETDYFFVEYTGANGTGSHQICGAAVEYTIPAGSSLLGNGSNNGESGPATGE